MRILWLIPPLDGFPNISQYRFFKRMPIRATIIYPYLAASGVTMLQKDGHDAAFMDSPTLELGWDRVDPLLDPLDLVIMEARTPIMEEIWKAISHIRSVNPKVRISLYGDHVTWKPWESISEERANFVIMGGDYDIGARELAQRIDQGGAIPRAFPARAETNLDKLPWVDRERAVFWEPYYESWKTRDVFLWNMSMRGCYYHCVYCAWAETCWSNKLRKRSPADVAEETAWLHKEYGDFQYLDDADLFDISWGVQYVRALKRRGLTKKEVIWGVQTHPNMIKSLEDLKELKAGGMNLVKLGLESGNQRSLDLMRKGLKVHQSELAIMMLQEADIGVHANLIVGFPWETKAEAYHTIDWIKRLKPNQAQFSLLIPYPNTQLHEMAQKKGWLTVPVNSWSQYDASQPMMRMEDLDGDGIIQLYKDSWRKFYLDPGFIWRNLIRVRSWSEIKQLYHGFRSVVYGHMRAVD